MIFDTLGIKKKKKKQKKKSVNYYYPFAALCCYGHTSRVVLDVIHLTKLNNLFGVRGSVHTDTALPDSHRLKTNAYALTFAFAKNYSLTATLSLTTTLPSAGDRRLCLDFSFVSPLSSGIYPSKPSLFLPSSFHAYSE